MRRYLRPLKFLVAAAFVALTVICALGASCPDNGTAGSELPARFARLRDALHRMQPEFSVPPGEHVLDVDINCVTDEPHCITILTRPMERRERPRRLTLYLPNARRPAPVTITIQETAASGR